MIPIQNTEMAADAIGKLTSAFREKANVRAVTSAFASEVQDLMDNVWKVLDAIQNPSGDLLTRRARIVGEERNGRSDADLLAAYQIRIRANRSQGVSEDLIQVSNLMGPSTYTEYAPATWLVECYNCSNPRVLYDLLLESKSGGSRGCFEYTPYPASENLIWGSTVGSVPTATAGWATSTLYLPQPPDATKFVASFEEVVEDQ